MAFYTIPSNIKISILNFVKHLLPKQTINDIDAILSPCCIPILEITPDNFACESGTSNTVFTSVKVSFPEAANKDVTLIFTFTNTNNNNEISAAAVHTTLDNKGEWTDSVTVAAYFSDDTSNVTVSVLVDGARVVSTSNVVFVENIPNCD